MLERIFQSIHNPMHSIELSAASEPDAAGLEAEGSRRNYYFFLYDYFAKKFETGFRPFCLVSTPSGRSIESRETTSRRFFRLA
jgi:hypothetical protein